MEKSNVTDCDIYAFDSAATFLRRCLIERMSRNPRYSLRRFAQTLNLAPSTLSEVLKGKKRLSSRRTHELATSLGLEGEAGKFLSLLMARDRARSPRSKAKAERDLAEIRGSRQDRLDFDTDQFALVADWYHIAILELVQVKVIAGDALQVGRSLGISVQEAQDAIERLLRLGLLIETDGRLQRRRGRIRIECGDRNRALCQFHRQMLDLSKASLDEQVPAQRINATETFAIAEPLLSELRARCDRFLDEVIELSRKSQKSQKSGEGLRVFHVGVHGFIVDRNEEILK